VSFQSIFYKAVTIAVLPVSIGASLLAPSVVMPSASSQAFSNPQIKSGPSSRGTALFRKLGVLQSGATQNRTLVLPASRSSASGSSVASKSTIVPSATGPALLFEDSSWIGYSNAQKKVLQDFLRVNLSRMVTLWGPPPAEQYGQKIYVENEPSIDAAYQPPALNSDRPGGTIFFRFVNGATNEVNTYNFSRLVFLAFWGARIPSFDFNEAKLVEPWVYGMSDAAALQIAYQAGGSKSSFDPSALGGYLLPVYDFFNRPELSSAFIYPPNAVADDPILTLSDIRLTMAQAAFLKVAVEKPTFFSEFNAAYYNASTPREAVSPEQLKNIAAGVVPSVEGTTFRDWARRQYALDSSITTGQKLYFGLLPLPSATSGDTRSGFNGYVLAFTTDSQGNESVSTGYGSVQALNETGADISSTSSEIRNSNVLNFSTAGYLGQGVNGDGVFGAGFSNIGADKARIAVKIRFKEAEAIGYFPYGVAGNIRSNSSFYGATLGADSGTLKLGSENVNVTRGVFNASTAYSSGPAVKTQLTFNGVTLKRNTAWFKAGNASRSAGFLLEVPAATNNINFSISGGSSRLRMVSFPLVPAKTDEAEMLNLEPESLELARYRPNLSPATRQGDALIFGIDGDRHEIYPYISEGVAPGRGYWMATGVTGFSTTIVGSEPPRSTPYEVPLLGGWNQFGVPFNRDFAPGAVKVRYGGFAPVSLAVAQERGWVTPGIWRWLPGGNYERVDVQDGGDLKAFEGYYIFANPQRGVSLVFEVGTQVAKLTARNGWSVPLLASGAKNRDKTARFGVSNDENIAKPPVATKVVNLRFVENDSEPAAIAGGGLAESFVTSIEGAGTWTAILEGTNAGERITLSWGKLKSLPKTVTLTLRDEKTGQTKKMSAGGTYKFKSDGAPHRLTFTVTSKTSAPKSPGHSSPVSGWMSKYSSVKSN
jgi:hypothetical protein